MISIAKIALTSENCINIQFEVKLHYVRLFSCSYARTSIMTTPSSVRNGLGHQLTAPITTTLRTEKAVYDPTLPPNAEKELGMSQRLLIKHAILCIIQNAALLWRFCAATFVLNCKNFFSHSVHRSLVDFNKILVFVCL